MHEMTLDKEIKGELFVGAAVFEGLLAAINWHQNLPNHLVQFGCYAC